MILFDSNSWVFVIHGNGEVVKGKIVATQTTTNECVVTVRLYTKTNPFYLMLPPEQIFLTEKEANNYLSKRELTVGDRGWLVIYNALGLPTLYEVKITFTDIFTKGVLAVRTDTGQTETIMKNSFYPTKEQAIDSIALALQQRLVSLTELTAAYKDICDYLKAL